MECIVIPRGFWPTWRAPRSGWGCRSHARHCGRTGCGSRSPSCWSALSTSFKSGWSARRKRKLAQFISLFSRHWKYLKREEKTVFSAHFCNFFPVKCSFLFLAGLDDLFSPENAISLPISFWSGCKTELEWTVFFLGKKGQTKVIAFEGDRVENFEGFFVSAEGEEEAFAGRYQLVKMVIASPT